MTIEKPSYDFSVSLSSLPINLHQAKPSELYNDEETAAELVFMGRVVPNTLNNHGKGRVIGIDYSIDYERFSQKVAEIVDQVCRAIPEITKVHVVHRNGFVATGDHAVVVTIGSRHRTTAALAVDIIVSRMKSEAFVEKTEIFACK